MNYMILSWIYPLDHWVLNILLWSIMDILLMFPLYVVRYFLL